MADLKYRVDIETKRARAGVDNLRTSINGLATAFVGLLGAVSAVKLAQFADSVTNAANKLKLLTPSANEAEQAFEGLAAIAISARTPLESVSDVYFKLALNAKALGISNQEAAGVTDSLAKAITASGVSASDASRVLTQLGQIFGKAKAEGEELTTIMEGLPIVAQALAKSLGLNTVGELKKAAEQGKVTGAAIVKALQEAKTEIDNLFSRTDPTFSQGITQVQTAFALLTRELLKSSEIGQTFSNIVLFIVAQLRILSKDVDAVIGPIKTFIQVVGVIVSFTLVGKVLRGLFGAFAALRTGVLGATTAIGQFLAAVGAFIGIEKAAESVAEIGKEGTESAKIIADLKKEMAELAKTSFSTVKPEGGGPATPAIDPNKIKQAVGEVKNLSVEYARTLENQRKSLELENSLIGATEKQRQVRTALAELEEDYLNKKAQLEQRVAQLSLSTKEEDKAKSAEIKAQLELITGEYQKQVGALQTLKEQNFELNEAIKQRQALTNFSLNSELDTQKKIREIQHDMATSTMTEMEKKYADIAFAAEESARAQIRAENSRRKSLGLVKLTTAEEKEYFDAARKGQQDLADAERARFEQSRRFETGWKKAMNAYVDDATNAAKTAERVFQKATQGMEDAIVNFAKTGKFEFKSFLSSIAEEILRSQIRQLMANLFSTQSGGSGGGSIFGNLGKLLGFARGGVIPTNAPVVVGERGPELLVGARGNRVIPNNQIGGNTVVNYNINAVDAPSFQALVARDPAFIHAVATAGARQIPGGRR